MEIQFLGTGAGVPARHRNVTGIALKLLDELNQVWLFDCGEGTQMQILKTPLKPRKIEKIFITHLHGDHIFGLPGFLSSRSFQGGEAPVEIIGPVGIKRYIETTLSISKTKLSYPIIYQEIDESKVVLDNAKFTVYAEILDHGIKSFGYRVVEKDHQGELQVDKLKALGIPAGPLYGAIKNGQPVELSTGEVLPASDFIGESHKGRIITIFGDTRPTPQSVELARNADVMVHESTFGKGEEKMAKNYFHSTNIQAATIAKKAGAKQLLLTHISARYLVKDVEQLEIDAKEIFKNTQVMKDLDIIEIPLKKEG